MSRKFIAILLAIAFLASFMSCHRTKPPEIIPQPPTNWIIEKLPDGNYVVSTEFVVWAFRILGYANLYKIKYEECEKKKDE